MMLCLESRAKYNEGEVNIHYKTPIRREEKEFIPEDELRKRQEDQVRGHSYTTLVYRIEVQTQIKVQVGEFSKINKCAIQNKRAGKTSCKKSLNVQDFIDVQ